MNTIFWSNFCLKCKKKNFCNICYIQNCPTDKIHDSLLIPVKIKIKIELLKMQQTISKSIKYLENSQRFKQKVHYAYKITWIANYWFYIIIITILRWDVFRNWSFIKIKFGRKYILIFFFFWKCMINIYLKFIKLFILKCCTFLNINTDWKFFSFKSMKQRLSFTFIYTSGLEVEKKITALTSLSMILRKEINTVLYS